MIIQDNFSIALSLIDILKASSVWTTILLITIPLAIIFVISFFDFIVDIWKIPFFSVIDLIKINSINNNYLGYLSVFLGAVLFYILLKEKNKTLSKWMAGISVVLNCGFLFFGGNQLLIWAIVPINTLLICIANVLD